MRGRRILGVAVLAAFAAVGTLPARAVDGGTAAPPTEEVTNGTTSESADGTAVPSGQPIEESTKAVSAESDSFSDAQLEYLTVIVRMQNKSLPALRCSNSRTFSNGSLHSKSSVADEMDDVLDRSGADGTVASHE